MHLQDPREQPCSPPDVPLSPPLDPPDDEDEEHTDEVLDGTQISLEPVSNCNVKFWGGVPTATVAK